jgi:hypothetical protein
MEGKNAEPLKQYVGSKTNLKTCTTNIPELSTENKV